MLFLCLFLFILPQQVPMRTVALCKCCSLMTSVEQAIANETWTDGDPQQEEEDLWDDARLQVSVTVLFHG